MICTLICINISGNINYSYSHIIESLFKRRGKEKFRKTKNIIWCVNNIIGNTLYINIQIDIFSQNIPFKWELSICNMIRRLRWLWNAAHNIIPASDPRIKSILRPTTPFYLYDLLAAADIFHPRFRSPLLGARTGILKFSVTAWF